MEIQDVILSCGVKAVRQYKTISNCEKDNQDPELLTPTFPLVETRKMAARIVLVLCIFVFGFKAHTKGLVADVHARGFMPVVEDAK